MANKIITQKSKWEISFLGWNGIKGVYCIMSTHNGKNLVNYVGSSKNIGKRILNPIHPYKKLLKNDVSCFIKFKEIECTQTMLLLERRMIKKLKPFYNTKSK